jgi:hypothetical protein
MTGKLIFIHGTTVRDVSTYKDRLRQRAPKYLGVAADDIVALEWGNQLGFPDRDVKQALPEEYSRAVTDEPEVDEVATLWSLLLADPDAELRLMAADQGAAPGGIDFDGDASVEVADAVSDAPVPAAAVEAAGFDVAEFSVARDAVVASPALGAAASAVGDAQDAQLTNAVARSVVARMLVARQAATARGDGDLPEAFDDPVARDTLVDAVADAIHGSTLGERGLGDLFKKAGSGVLTSMLVKYRAETMVPLARFIHDVALYLNHGEEIRAFIEDGIRANSDKGPPIVIGHSLGGIAAVDILSNPANREGDKKLDVGTFVTVGSQAPALFLMDALTFLTHDRETDKRMGDPFAPWLNIYNREDLLSFCAKRVFPDVDGIKDVAVDAKVPFPASHSAYFAVDATYEAIRDFRA